MTTQLLRRKPGESICVGHEITVKVLDVQGLQVRLEIGDPQSAVVSIKAIPKPAKQAAQVLDAR